MSQRSFERKRPDGGIEVVIIVSEEDFNQALRGLIAHAEALGLDNAPSKRRQRDAARRTR